MIKEISNKSAPGFSSLSKLYQSILFITSFLIVGFGQPALSWPCGLIAAVAGYALFWRILFCYAHPSQRFWISAAWFGAVQLIQLYWLTSHPYLYIYAVYLVTALLFGLQFGILGVLINPTQICQIRRLLAIAGLWVLLEWIRLFILSGISWNPVGIALTSSIYPMQMASFWGIYGLSFWVIFANLLFLKAWQQHFSKGATFLWVISACVPYIYGGIHLNTHSHLMTQYKEKKPIPFNAVLVQTAFPVEEALPFWETKQMIAFIIDEWRQILKITKKQLGKQIDLIVLPEFTVPYGTYSAVFPHEVVKNIFKEILGEDVLEALPALSEPLAFPLQHGKDRIWMVNNAFWLQGIANIFNADIIAGLEDAEDKSHGQREYYSSAQYFKPTPKDKPVEIHRYDKRVLVPMAEYIPFSFCKDLAATYGIQGSFTCGTKAKIFANQKLPLGVSICYEETFGHIMRESRQLGAELLVNLTSDVWFPNSSLSWQHFDHARLRTVESGIPLIRACNTGITCGIDSLGRVVAILGETPEQQEWLSDSIHINVPTYTYQTVYSMVGDSLILGFSLLSILFTLRFRDFK